MNTSASTLHENAGKRRRIRDTNRAMAGMRFTWVALLGALAVGCGGASADDPRGVLHRYAKALEEGRADDAYRLLSDEAKRAMAIEQFRKLLKENPEEAKELGRILSRPASAPYVTAKVSGGGGQEFELVLEDGKWRLDLNAVDLYAQDTPRHAIVGFLRAVEQKRYDMAMRYVPDSHRAGLDPAKLKAAWEGPEREAIEAMRVGVKRALTSSQIEETGDRAALPYNNGTMQLVKERGVWKIEDFD